MTDQAPTRTDDRWHLNRITTERGFTYLPDIPSEYGGHISVSESSAADGPHVWVRATCPVDLNRPNGPTMEAAMHLTADNARRIAEQLLLTVDEHYQGDDAGEDADTLLHPGDLVAAGLHHHTCPVGKVVNVTDHGFRLNLHDRDGNPTSGVAVVMWTQVVQFGPVIPNGGKADIGPLFRFRENWEVR